MIPQGWSRTALGLVIGTVVLALVTMLMVAAVYSFNTAGDVAKLSHNLVDANARLADANSQLDKLRQNESTTDARSARAQRERADLMDQNDLLQRQVSALVRYLRDHGIDAPVISPPAPKHRAPRRPHPKPKASPKPKSTPAPPTFDACAMFPLFCQTPFAKVVIP